MSVRKAERNAAIYEEWRWRTRNYAALGRKYGLSRDRVREICKAEARRRAIKN